MTLLIKNKLRDREIYLYVRMGRGHKMYDVEQGRGKKI